MKVRVTGVIAGLLLYAGPSSAATITVTMDNFKSVFLTAQAGDTIKLSGTFSHVALSGRSFATALKIDASKAIFTDALVFTDVSGVTMTGGTYHLTSGQNAYAKAISVVRGGNMSFDKLNVDGDGLGQGVAFSGSHNIKVSRSTFTRLKAGVTLSSVGSATLSANASVRAASDGFDIADSHNVSVTGNNCSGTDVGTTAFHPDCVQLWSIVGNPVQSDISITNNIVTGATQGITSFDPDTFSGEHITIHNNIINTSFPQGIACYGCFDSTITGNTVSTMAGSKSRTSINIIGGGRNTVSANVVGIKPVNGASVGDLTDDMDVPGIGSDDADDDGDISDPIDFGGDESAAQLVRFAGRSAPSQQQIMDPPPPEILADVTSLQAVPEPGVWALLIAGFGMTGLMQRRRRHFA